MGFLELTTGALHCIIGGFGIAIGVALYKSCKILQIKDTGSHIYNAPPTFRTIHIAILTFRLALRSLSSSSFSPTG